MTHAAYGPAPEIISFGAEPKHTDVASPVDASEFKAAAEAVEHAAEAVADNVHGHAAEITDVASATVCVDSIVDSAPAASAEPVIENTVEGPAPEHVNMNGDIGAGNTVAEAGDHDREARKKKKKKQHTKKRGKGSGARKLSFQEAFDLGVGANVAITNEKAHSTSVFTISQLGQANGFAAIMFLRTDANGVRHRLGATENLLVQQHLTLYTAA